MPLHIDREKIIHKVVQKFSCFGAGSAPVAGNPIAAAEANNPPFFALGVDVREVVYEVSCEVLEQAAEYLEKESEKLLNQSWS